MKKIVLFILLLAAFELKGQDDFQSEEELGLYLELCHFAHNPDSLIQVFPRFKDNSGATYRSFFLSIQIYPCAPGKEPDEIKKERIFRIVDSLLPELNYLNIEIYSNNDIPDIFLPHYPKLRQVEDLGINTPSAKVLPGSIGTLRKLSSFACGCDSLKSLPAFEKDIHLQSLSFNSRLAGFSHEFLPGPGLKHLRLTGPNWRLPLGINLDSLNEFYLKDSRALRSVNVRYKHYSNSIFLSLQLSDLAKLKKVHFTIGMKDSLKLGSVVQSVHLSGLPELKKIRFSTNVRSHSIHFTVTGARNLRSCTINADSSNRFIFTIQGCPINRFLKDYNVAHHTRLIYTDTRTLNDVNEGLLHKLSHVKELRVDESPKIYRESSRNQELLYEPDPMSPNYRALRLDPKIRSELQKYFNESIEAKAYGGVIYIYKLK